LDNTSVDYYRWDADRARFSSLYDMSRAVIGVSVRSGSELLHIANTHFTWTPDGKASEQQRIDLPQLLKKLEQYPELILCGDFNAPRGEEIFSQLCEHFTDNLPADVVSTIDPKLHRTQGKFDLAVDTIFSTPGYQVKDVQVFEGISDHKAIVGTIFATN
jgi:endonuclease/exonuclease/phosphatase (EEP) superfamily protein YafD